MDPAADKSEARKQADENAAAQTAATRTPREIVVEARQAPADAVAGAVRPMESLIVGEEAVTRMVVPHAFVLTLDNGQRYAFRAGVQPVPDRLAGHWYLKAHGVEPFDGISPNHTILRQAEDEELRAKRSAEDAEIAARRAKEDRDEMAALETERQANVAARTEKGAVDSGTRSLDGTAVGSQANIEVAAARAEEDRVLRERRAAEDASSTPDVGGIEARSSEDANVAARRAAMDARRP